MPRRRKEDALDGLFRTLVELPAFAGPIFIAGAYAFFRWLIPFAVRSAGSAGGGDQKFADSLTNVLGTMSVAVAPYAAIVVCVVWLLSLARKLVDRRRFDEQTGLDSIADLGWQDFEFLIGEFYRRQGYLVSVTGSNCGDGGVDVVLERGGEKTLVQCKHYRARRVGVKPVRELLGVMTSEGASGGIVVTSGSFTPDAEEFAGDNGITLIEGRELERMMRPLQQSRPGVAPQPAVPDAIARPVKTDAAPAVPQCPACGAPMVHRVARSGAHAGSAFWGCSKFPKCRGTRQIA